MVAAAVIGGGVLTAGSNLIGSQTAASGQQQAANTNLQAQQTANATSLQEQQNAQQQADTYWSRASDTGQHYVNEAQTVENPFINIGQGSGNILYNQLATGQLGVQPSLTDMSQLPGYQFTLDQGLKATQNAAAAQGLGVSGAAMKGATNYAEGLAGTFYNNYLSNYWANQNNRYNMLAGVMNTGANAANQLTSVTGGAGNQLVSTAGTLGSGQIAAAVNTGNTIANTTTGTAANIGQAQAGGAATQAAGLSSAGNSLSSILNNPAVLSSLSGSSLFGGSTVTGPAANASIAAGGPPLAPNISAANLNQVLGFA